MRLRLVTAAAVSIAIGIVVAVALWIPNDTLGSWVRAVRDARAVGVAIFFAASVVLTVALVPGMLTTLVGGLLYGVWGGFAVSWAAGVTGAIASFAIGRYLGRKRVARWLEGRPRIDALDRAIQQRGVRVVILARLSPLLPFPILNYALPLTRVSLRDYIIGSVVGMIPLTFATAYAGAMMGNITRMLTGGGPERGTWQELGLWAGLAATVALTWLLVRASKHELRAASRSPG